MSDRTISRLRRELQQAQDALLSAAEHKGTGGANLRDFIKSGGSLRPFDWSAYNRDQEKRAIERTKRWELTQQLIETGYRALAHKMHPDVGGSVEDMARLSEVRKELTLILGLIEKPRKRRR